MNNKLNNNYIFKLIFLIMLIPAIIFFLISIYKIFFRTEISIEDEFVSLEDTIHNNKTFEITSKNYTNILQAVTNDIDSYIGCKVHFVGYVYRLIDFKPNEFVLARNMIVNENTSQSLVVGFLCNYSKAIDFPDNIWVDVLGTIQKGNYYGDIAIINVENMFECDKPKDDFVSMPDNTYIPTNSML